MFIGQESSVSGFNDPRLREGFLAVVGQSPPPPTNAAQRRPNDSAEEANKF